MSLFRRLPAALLMGVLLATSACSSGNGGEAGSDADAAPRQVTTDKGEVEIPGDPQTIVVLNSNLAGYLYTLDVPVAATLPDSPGPGGGNDYPEAWADEATEDETVILPWGEDGFDFEAILNEKPDLIIAGGQGFAAFQADEAYDRLTEIAPTVYVSTELVTWQDQLEFLAVDVFDDPETHDELLTAYNDRVAEVKDAITVPASPVVYLVTTADGTPFSLPENSQLPQTLAAVGFEPEPVIANNPEFETYGTGDSFELSTEQVGVVLTAPGMFVVPFFAEQGLEIEDLKQDPVYAELPAFQNDQVWALPDWAYRADYIRTMNLLDELESMFG